MMKFKTKTPPCPLTEGENKIQNLKTKQKSSFT